MALCWICSMLGAEGALKVALTISHDSDYADPRTHATALSRFLSSLSAALAGVHCLFAPGAPDFTALSAVLVGLNTADVTAVLSGMAAAVAAQYNWPTAASALAALSLQRWSQVCGALEAPRKTRHARP